MAERARASSTRPSTTCSTKVDSKYAARDLRVQARTSDQRLLRRPARGKPVRQRRAARRLHDRRQAALGRAARDQRGQAHRQADRRVDTPTPAPTQSSPPAPTLPLNIVVGITGGIAAYKAVGVVRAFVLAGHDVHVVADRGRPAFRRQADPRGDQPQPGAHRASTRASPRCGTWLSGRPPTSSSSPRRPRTRSRSSPRASPTTCSATPSSRAPRPLVIAPAMHTEMWQQPGDRGEHRDAAGRGVAVVGPAVGRLTGSRLRPRAHGGARGDRRGRPRRAGRRPPRPRRAAASSSPPAALGNRSTPCASSATARAASRASRSPQPPRARGADVTLIAANLEVAAPAGVTSRVGRPLELAEAAADGRRSDADVVVMAAAVADYRPARPSTSEDQEGDHGRPAQPRAGTQSRHPGGARGSRAGRRAGHHRLRRGDRAGHRQVARAGARQDRQEGQLTFWYVNRVGWNEGFATDGNAVVVVDTARDIVIEATGTKIVGGRSHPRPGRLRPPPDASDGVIHEHSSASVHLRVRDRRTSGQDL